MVTRRKAFMSETVVWALLGLAFFAVGAWVWRGRTGGASQMPPDLALRLGLIEQQLQAVLQSSARAQASGERAEAHGREALASAAQAQEAMRHLLDDKLDQTLQESRQGRADLTATLRVLTAETQAAREAMARSAQLFEQQIQARFDALRQDLLAQLGTLSQASQHHAEQLRATLNERLAAIQADNTEKLEVMRRTVDEKLHATLEQRLGDSFKLVSERLELVHAGLGEMKTLAGSVGDLKRVMTNVRARGTWGEVQLGAIIESLLTAEQYAKNVKTVPGSTEWVEFAIQMPGKTDDETVWLPIDSKYPVEHYQRLMDAHEQADKEAIAKASTAFESSLKVEAKKIQEKYLHPPQTTDFAILFVPTEGLFAEICRIPGMVEGLQNQFRVVVAGPTTLAAMLNSLRLGFRTLAIEKRSSEVWNVLSGVKTEFRKFGEIVEATHKSIDTAARKFSEIGTRTRAIERKLRGVEALPVGSPDALEASRLLALDDEPVP
jgi:DNA recombination protein RmuC